LLICLKNPLESLCFLRNIVRFTDHKDAHILSTKPKMAYLASITIAPENRLRVGAWIRQTSIRPHSFCMTLTTSTTTPDWTEFEKNEWKQADTDHYGLPLEWKKLNFLIMAKEDDMLIGTLRLDIREGVAYVDAIIVAAEHRGQGIGQQLMQEAERIARENHAHKLYLQTGKEWGTLDFYQSLGYEISSELPNHYHRVDFVEMTKFLE